MTAEPLYPLSFKTLVGVELVPQRKTEFRPKVLYSLELESMSLNSDISGPFCSYKLQFHQLSPMMSTRVVD